jgi:BirA family biotin operon repressor/biotin-[acetyl-CoA-carboxylase] ligase
MSWDPKLFARHLSTRRFGRECHLMESVDSTNRWLLEHHAEFMMSGAIVISEHQTAGRGRRERRWFDNPGHSILCSLLVRHEHSPQGAAFLSMIPAIAIARVLTRQADATISVALKWPNDVLINHKKVAGTLAQSTVQGTRHLCVIGCGINVSTPSELFPAELRDKASSVWSETRKQVPREILLAEILNELEPLFDQWLNHEFDSLRQAWEYFGPDTGVELIREQDGESVRGSYAGLGSYGQLLLRDERGELTECFTGDIGA